MGYTGEKASLNQYSLIKNYLMDSGAVEQMKSVYDITERFYKDIENQDSGKAEVVETDCSLIKPFDVMAVDAGMARFFKDSPYEVVVLKIAGGANEVVQKKHVEIMKAEFTHVFTGLIKNPRVFAAITNRNERDGAASLTVQEVDRLFQNGLFSDLNKLFNSLFEGDFIREVQEWLGKSKKLPEIDNLTRELAEWYYLLRASLKIDNNLLIVKDGSLITNQFGSGQALAKRLDSFFRGEVSSLSPIMVGVVKESRFIKDEGHIVAKTIRTFSKLLPGNQFFRIPNALEVLLDSTTEENKAVDRLFLSIASGKNVYEVQFPRALTKDPKLFLRARVTLLSQITSLYGGSIVANSLAHKAASLSEAEARSLEKELRFLAGLKK
jgi:hypothetical protein